jgi:exopolysaccharide biosynthesis polyprenyl glycosylphosphotransferase
MPFFHIRTNEMIKFLKRNWRQIYIILAVITDSIFLAFSSFLAFWIRNNILALPPIDQRIYLGLFFISWIVFISFAAMLGLYRAAYHTEMRDLYTIGIRAYLYALPTLFSMFYIFKIEDFPRRFILIFYLLIPFFFSLGRNCLDYINSLLRRKGFGSFNALVLGYNGQSEKVIEMFHALPYLGCEIKGIIAGSFDRKKKRSYDPSLKMPIFEYKKLEEVIESEDIQRILIPSIEEAAGAPALLKVCQTENIDLQILSPEFNKMYEFAHIYDIAGIPLYSRKRIKTARLKALVKRITDIIGASCGIILSLPIIIFASIAIFIEDGRPIFFTQKRSLTENGKLLKVIKFRTMKRGAEDKQDDLLKSNETSGGLFFIRKDPRVTKVGKFLRKYSIDEIPQLFNVLIGNMSLVGPRPLTLSDLRNITPENRLGGYYELRNNAKPGVTGLWQISGRREVNFKEMVLLDLYYIENHSLMFDLEILFATVGVVLSARGGH